MENLKEVEIWMPIKNIIHISQFYQFTSDKLELWTRSDKTINQPEFSKKHHRVNPINKQLSATPVTFQDFQTFPELQEEAQQSVRLEGLRGAGQTPLLLY